MDGHCYILTKIYLWVALISSSSNIVLLKYCSENLFLNIQINIPLENNPVETFLVFTYVLLYPYLEFDHQTIVTVHWYEIENTKRKEMRYWWPMFWWCLLILIRLPHRDITLCRSKSMYNHVYHWHKELYDIRNLTNTSTC